MTVTPYFGLESCCDCDRTGNYIVRKNGYQFTVCSTCLQSYFDDDDDDEED